MKILLSSFLLFSLMINTGFCNNTDESISLGTVTDTFTVPFNDNFIKTIEMFYVCDNCEDKDIVVVDFLTNAFFLGIKAGSEERAYIAYKFLDSRINELRIEVSGLKLAFFDNEGSFSASSYNVIFRDTGFQEKKMNLSNLLNLLEKNPEYLQKSLNEVYKKYLHSDSSVILVKTTGL